jgi:putative chitinase
VCISASVGEGGKNHRSDGVIVQILLNFNRTLPLTPLEVDGGVGPGTKAAIVEFQKTVLKQEKPDGRIDPNGKTIAELRKGIPFKDGLTETILRGIMPSATVNKIRLYHQHLLNVMATRQITTLLRQAHFLAQLGHESGGFVYSEEIASGAAYEGRADLGNTEEGDGKRFKGRGLIQLTGRANYTKYGKSIDKDLTTGDNPKLVATDPKLAVDAAGWFWSVKELNSLADADNVTAITKKVNGGLNGFADRKAYLARAKFFLGL